MTQVDGGVVVSCANSLYGCTNSFTYKVSEPTVRGLWFMLQRVGWFLEEWRSGELGKAFCSLACRNRFEVEEGKLLEEFRRDANAS